MTFTCLSVTSPMRFSIASGTSGVSRSAASGTTNITVSTIETSCRDRPCNDHRNAFGARRGQSVERRYSGGSSSAASAGSRISSRASSGADIAHDWRSVPAGPSARRMSANGQRGRRQLHRAGSRTLQASASFSSTFRLRLELPSSHVTGARGARATASSAIRTLSEVPVHSSIRTLRHRARRQNLRRWRSQDRPWRRHSPQPRYHARLIDDTTRCATGRGTRYRRTKMFSASPRQDSQSQPAQ